MPRTIEECKQFLVEQLAARSAEFLEDYLMTDGADESGDREAALKTWLDPNKWTCWDKFEFDNSYVWVFQPNEQTGPLECLNMIEVIETNDELTMEWEIG